MASQVIYFLIEFSELTKRSFSKPNEIFQCFWGVSVSYKRKISHWNDGHYLQSYDEKRVWRPASFGLSWTCSGTREDTLSWEYEDQRLLTTLFPVNKSHRQFYDSWKIDDPEPSWPWNRQLQNSCRPWWKEIHGIFIELMLLVNLYIFCNGMEWNLSPKIRKNSLFVIYFTIFSRVS